MTSDLAKQVFAAYCAAWETSFRAENPFSTVTMSQSDKRHINAGLEAAITIFRAYGEASLTDEELDAICLEHSRVGEDLRNLCRAAQHAKDAQQGAVAVCAEAYQVVGSMLSDLGQFETDRAEKILDNLSQARMVHDDVLPWPSFVARALGLARDAEYTVLGWLVSNSGGDDDFINNLSALSGRHYKGRPPIPLYARAALAAQRPVAVPIDGNQVSRDGLQP